MNIYYADGDRQVGPIGKAELQTLIKAKKVNSQTMVWQPGMHAWQELGPFCAPPRLRVGLNRYSRSPQTR